MSHLKKEVWGETVPTENDKVEQTSVKEKKPIEELSGKLRSDPELNKLMHSVLDNDKKTVEHGKIIEEAFNNTTGAFTPNMMYENLISNYRMAKKLYGEKLIRLLTGYNPDYVEKNLGIPEFRKEIQKNIAEKLKDLKDDGLITKEGDVSEKGIDLSSVILYMEELDHIVPKTSWGEHVSKDRSVYGDKGDVKPFKKSDRYRDVALRKSIKTAIRRGHKQLLAEDLKSFERESKGQVNVIYALDSSSSMKGEKIAHAKKAGIALAYKAISNKDSVGLIVFGDEIVDAIAPTRDFTRILRAITPVRAAKQTNLAKTIIKATDLFGGGDSVKHLIILTDAVPTTGKDDPETDTMRAASIAVNANITVSVMGVGLKQQGVELAKKIVDIGKGKFYTVKNLGEMDRLVLEDYQELRA